MSERESTETIEKVPNFEGILAMAATAWPLGWDDNLRRLWRRTLRDVSPMTLSKAMDRVVLSHEDRYPPPVGTVAAAAREIDARTRGAVLRDRAGVRFLEAAPDHRDPPGTVSWIVVQPDGRRIPANARAAGE